MSSLLQLAAQSVLFLIIAELSDYFYASMNYISYMH